jgi:phospho-N-acetylmuramoyl-pentapeptide-transferase
MNSNYLLVSLLVFLSSFLITSISEKRLIPILKRSAAQPIYSEGPVWHMKKSGTPTMGGLGFTFSIIITISVSCIFLYIRNEIYYAVSLALSLAYIVLNSLIGLIDDFAKIKKRENLGLTVIQKLSLQTIVAIMYLLSRKFLLGASSSIYFSFGEVDLGIFYIPLTLIMLLGSVNSANLTDGVDGIASAVAFAIGIVLANISFNANTEVCLLSFASLGTALAFLVFNLHPAKIFMGDTGSLLFGAIAATSCISLGNPLLIIPLGIVYFIEGASVILQVAWYKLTKKRILKMAPIHHHLEKCGWSENKIVIWSILITLLTSILFSRLFVF